LQKTNGSCHFQLVPFPLCEIPETWSHENIETWRWWHQTETEARAIYLNPVTVCSSCKRKFSCYHWCHRICLWFFLLLDNFVTLPLFSSLISLDFR
jgi:hypothetical protein